MTRIHNAILQEDDRIIVSAQFVVTGPLSYEQRLNALSTLIDGAAQSLELPNAGPLSAELLYRLADDRAGATILPLQPPARETACSNDPREGGVGRLSVPKAIVAWTALVLICGLALAAPHFLAEHGFPAWH